MSGEEWRVQPSESEGASMTTWPTRAEIEGATAWVDSNTHMHSTVRFDKLGRTWAWQVTGWRAGVIMGVLACIPVGLIFGAGFLLGRS